MKFKDPYMETQYRSRPEDLKQICKDFCTLSELFNIEPIVTRVLDQVDGSSGVHEAGRGVDFRDENLGKRLYTDGQATLIESMINLKYSRVDGKRTIIHHNFNKGVLHFHIQSPSSMSKYSNKEVFKWLKY